MYFSGVTGPCATGQYSLARSTSCTDCPAGYSCSATNVSPGVCASGSYSTGKQTSCTACPAGKACPSTTSDSGNYNCPSGN